MASRSFERKTGSVVSSRADVDRAVFSSEVYVPRLPIKGTKVTPEEATSSGVKSDIEKLLSEGTSTDSNVQ